MNSEDLSKRLKNFSHDCIKLAMTLPNSFLGNYIRNQLTRCSSSAASNYRATCLAQSKAAFIAKLSIVLEETDESHFWLEFINDEKLLNKDIIMPLLKEANELKSIFISSRKTARKNI